MNNRSDVSAMTGLPGITIAPPISHYFPAEVIDGALAAFRDTTECSVCGNSIGDAQAALQATQARDETGEVVEFTVTHGSCRTSRMASKKHLRPSSDTTQYRTREAVLPVNNPDDPNAVLPHLFVNATLDQVLFFRLPEVGEWSRVDVGLLPQYGFVPYGQPLGAPATGVAAVADGHLRVSTPAGDWTVGQPDPRFSAALQAHGGVLVAVIPSVQVETITSAAAAYAALTSPGALVGWVRTG